MRANVENADCTPLQGVPEEALHFRQHSVEHKSYRNLQLNNLKGDPLEIQHPKFENSRLGFIESVHEI